MRDLLKEECETLEAVKAVTGIRSPEEWNGEIMRLFWGWFSSEHSRGLDAEQHETVIMTIWGLTEFFTEIAVIQGRLKAYEAGKEEKGQ